MTASLLERLSAVLREVMDVAEESDDALVVTVDGTVASLRVVTIGEGLEMVSLTQPLAWDLPLTNKTRARVIEHAATTMLGTVTLVERDSKDQLADVLLRYNFPAAGLTDDALRTLILMVLSTGADIRAALTA
jgi:hypothetical protein